MKNKKFYLALVIFSLVGQVAWVVENMYLNVFIYKMFHASAAAISTMVAASAVAATVTTVFVGAFSDKIGKEAFEKMGLLKTIQPGEIVNTRIEVIFEAI